MRAAGWCRVCRAPGAAPAARRWERLPRALPGTVSLCAQSRAGVLSEEWVWTVAEPCVRCGTP